MATLTRDEAERRFELIDVRGYDLTLDLDTGEEVFASTSSIVFGCGMPGASSWLDVSARTVSRVLLNGESLDVATVVDGRLPLPGLRAVNTVLVEATMAYSNDGQGLHRAVDPADGRHYVFGHLFLDAAPRVFGCFDQPDLKAPFTLRV